jgi:hypothetical protein
MNEKPRVKIDTYADGSPAILIYLPGETAGWPIEECGTAAATVLAAYVASVRGTRECPCVAAEKPLCGPDCWHFKPGRQTTCKNCGCGGRGRKP